MNPLSEYAQSIGVTEADAHTARNIHLSVADCKHLRATLRAGRMPRETPGPLNDAAEQWNQELLEYFKGAV